MAESTASQTGFDLLLIRTALDAGLRQRLLDSPDSVFAEFDLTEEQQDLLRHPDHRLLPLLGAMLARQAETGDSAGRAFVLEAPIPPGNPMSDGPPPLAPPAPRTLPDVLLALTIVPCARPGNPGSPAYSYAVWVNPLPAGVDPSSLPPPAGAQLPGQPSTPLHAVVQLNAIEYRDASGRPQVGLSASLRQASNITGPATPGSQMLPHNRPHSTAVAAAVANVRSATAEQRYARLIDLLRALDSEAT